MSSKTGHINVSDYAVVELIEKLKARHEHSIEQLSLVVAQSKDDEVAIRVGDDLELKGRDKKMFIIGVMIALETFGKFPVVKVEPVLNDDDDEEGDDE